MVLPKKRKLQVGFFKLKCVTKEFKLPKLYSTKQLNIFETPNPVRDADYPNKAMGMRHRPWLCEHKFSVC